jgi:hypothetical protein
VRPAVALTLLLTSCAKPTAPAPVIDPRLAASVPVDASAVAGFRPSEVPGLAASFGDARYVLVSMRGTEVSTAVLAADGSVSGPGTKGGVSPLLAEGKTLAAKHPAWAVIRGGAPLPLKGNLANVNNLLMDAELITAGTQQGDPFLVELTATCPSEERAQRLEGSLRAVILLLKGEGSLVRREGRVVKGWLRVPACVINPASCGSASH